MVIVWYWRELVNKAELIDALAVRLGEKKTASAALDAVLAEVQAAVTKGDKVSITGFGVFEKRVRAARMARNPRTGEAVKVKKTAIPAFRPGAGFKDMVSSGKAPAAARKTTAKAATKTTARTTTAKATTAKATAAKATTAKATTPRKTTAKATTGKATTAKATPAKKTVARKTTAATGARKTAATKAVGKKAPATKTVAKKAPARKAR
jgi:DNA-binding protein HU-beta